MAKIISEIMEDPDSKDPVYDVVDKKKATSLSDECPDTGSRYSMKTNELYSVRKENPKEVNKNSCDKKILACVFIAFIFLFLFTLISAVVGFIEISKLKSKVALSTSSLQQHIMEPNEDNYMGLNQDFAELSQELKETFTLAENIISFE